MCIYPTERKLYKPIHLASPELGFINHTEESVRGASHQPKAQRRMRMIREE